MHVRLLGVAAGFCLLFGTVALKATFATIISPMAPEARQLRPQVPDIPKIDPKSTLTSTLSMPQVRRAMIVDRNNKGAGRLAAGRPALRQSP